MAAMRNEAEFLAGYDPREYPAVPVDVVALTIRAGGLGVLLVERGEQPFAGNPAPPGGFESETLDEAALRELGEKSGLRPGEGVLAWAHLEQLRTYGNPGRDPRMRVSSVPIPLPRPCLIRGPALTLPEPNGCPSIRCRETTASGGKRGGPRARFGELTDGGQAAEHAYRKWAKVVHPMA